MDLLRYRLSGNPRLSGEQMLEPLSEIAKVARVEVDKGNPYDQGSYDALRKRASRVFHFRAGQQCLTLASVGVPFSVGAHSRMNLFGAGTLIFDGLQRSGCHAHESNSNPDRLRRNVVTLPRVGPNAGPRRVAPAFGLRNNSRYSGALAGTFHRGRESLHTSA